MDLREFRELTRNLPEDTEIVIASDSEGNEKMVVTGYSESLVDEVPEWGEVDLIHPDDVEEDYGDDADLRLAELTKVFVLWP
jgi:hypothetical protein